MNTGVKIFHPVPRFADPTATPRVVFPTPNAASVPGTGFLVPRMAASNACQLINFPPPNMVALKQNPNPYGTMRFRPASAAPLPRACPRGPAPTNCVKVTPVGATRNAFVTPATPMIVDYPPGHQAPIIRPMPRYRAPAPGTKVVPPRQNGPIPTFGLPPVSRVRASSPTARHSEIHAGDSINVFRPISPAPSTGPSVELFRPVPRYGVPLPEARIVPPRHNSPPPASDSSGFRPISPEPIKNACAEVVRPVPCYGVPLPGAMIVPPRQVCSNGTNVGSEITQETHRVSPSSEENTPSCVAKADQQLNNMAESSESSNKFEAYPQEESQDDEHYNCTSLLISFFFGRD